jgi:adenylylsulfate kinase
MVEWPRAYVTTESHTRSIVKAVSYRILGSATTGLIFFVLTGKAGLSLGAGALDVVLKIGVYFLHERLWDRINFGRERKAPEYEI